MYVGGNIGILSSTRTGWQLRLFDATTTTGSTLPSPNCMQWLTKHPALEDVWNAHVHLRSY